MVERRCDKSNISGRSMSTHERKLFNELKDILQIQEEPLTSPNLQFLWDNARLDADRVMARLDRVYLFPASTTSHMKILEYRIRGDHSRSDHNLVSFIVELAKPPSCPSRYSMLTKYFDAVDYDVRTTWLLTPPIASYFTKLKKVTRYYRQFCIRKAHTNKLEEDTIRTRLDSKTRDLQNSPLDIDRASRGGQWIECTTQGLRGCKIGRPEGPPSCQMVPVQRLLVSRFFQGRSRNSSYGLNH